MNKGEKSYFEYRLGGLNREIEIAEKKTNKLKKKSFMSENKLLSLKSERKELQRLLNESES